MTSLINRTCIISRNKSKSSQLHSKVSFVSVSNLVTNERKLIFNERELFVSAEWCNKNAINSSDGRKECYETDLHLKNRWTDLFVPGRYLIDHGNNECQFSRDRENLPILRLIQHCGALLMQLYALFSVAEAPTSWMNARWTSESKPSWPGFYWSCHCWHLCGTWYTRSVSEALLQRSFVGKCNNAGEKKGLQLEFGISLKVAHLLDLSW